MRSRGFTLIEMLLGIAILALISGIAVTSFSNYRQKEAVDKGANQIASLFEKARYQTLSARAGSVYGVQMATTTAILFQDTYSAGATTNTKFTIDPSVEISYSFTGGTNEIKFNKFTAETTATGTITVFLKADSTNKRIITIYSTGVIEQQ